MCFVDKIHHSTRKAMQTNAWIRCRCVIAARQSVIYCHIHVDRVFLPLLFTESILVRWLRSLENSFIKVARHIDTEEEAAFVHAWTFSPIASKRYAVDRWPSSLLVEKDPIKCMFYDKRFALLCKSEGMTSDLFDDSALAAWFQDFFACERLRDSCEDVGLMRHVQYYPTSSSGWSRTSWPDMRGLTAEVWIIRCADKRGHDAAQW